MSIERTLSIIKPDGVARDVIGEIYTRFEQAGLKIIAASMKQLSREQAEEFYAVHKERPFFADLVKFMTSGPVMAQVLEGENAISRNRELMGATNPKEAAPGTIRGGAATRPVSLSLPTLERNGENAEQSLRTMRNEIAELTRQVRLLVEHDAGAAQPVPSVN